MYNVLCTIRPAHRNGALQPVAGARAAGRAARGVLELGGPGAARAGAQSHPARRLLCGCYAASAGPEDSGNLLHTHYVDLCNI